MRETESVLKLDRSYSWITSAGFLWISSSLFLQLNWYWLCLLTCGERGTNWLSPGNFYFPNWGFWAIIYNWLNYDLVFLNSVNSTEMSKMFSRLETPFQSIWRGKERDAFSPTYCPFSLWMLPMNSSKMHSEGIMPPLTRVLFLTLIPRFLGPLQWFQTECM